MSIAKGIALVTGSAQGIGRSIALRLARDGFNIALNDVASKRHELRVVANDIEGVGRKTHVIPGDVASEEDVEGMVRSTAEQLGGLDVMVANAGICLPAELVSTELDDWERVMAVNARGVFLCYKHAAVQMTAQGRGGRIIGASSAAGKSAYPLLSAYAASKFAIRGLTQAAALELGRHQITVNSYAPGATTTPMRTAMTGPSGAFQKLNEDFAMWNKNNVDKRPIQLEGLPEDVASLVSYLASKEAYLITGQCISVDGGMVLS